MIILSLGSNLSSVFGDRSKNIKMAMSFLTVYGIKIIKESSFYETPSYPNINDPKFLNNVIAVESNLTPVDLMSVLIFIEKKIGRIRIRKNEPRTCDIDIIDFDSKILNFDYENLKLEIPHKKLSSRNFVLFPLQEILPNWKHPKTNENISTLIDKLPAEQRKSIFKINKN